MTQASHAPFENVESAYEYIGLLCEALDEASETVEQEMSAPLAFTGARHHDALRLVDYKLKTLREHLLVSRRLVGDLRTLRRHLLGERTSERSAKHDTAFERRPAISSQNVGQV
jgi:hypothetical protein